VEENFTNRTKRLGGKNRICILRCALGRVDRMHLRGQAGSWGGVCAYPNGAGGSRGRSAGRLRVLPRLQVYYSSNLRQFTYLEGRSWVSRPAPPRVSVDVLFASPSVRLDFHDSPANHHASVSGSTRKIGRHRDRVTATRKAATKVTKRLSKVRKKTTKHEQQKTFPEWEVNQRQKGKMRIL